MKNVFLSLAAVVVLAACGPTTYTNTSANEAYSTPVNLQTTFSTQYPNAANVSWSAYDATTVPIDWEMTGWSTMDASDHVVSFDMDGQRYYAWYDTDGTWVGSTYAVDDHSKLPTAVQTLLNDRYTGYSIVKVHQEMWKDQMAYEIKLKKNDDDKVKLLVDTQGNVLKEKLKD
ncbi:PepSY-like domain-containing protein [Flavisolibacter sp. BT320]|nr:PepSY-like domain-containing protein [Flavisolibacter longurius]